MKSSSSNSPDHPPQTSFDTFVDEHRPKLHQVITEQVKHLPIPVHQAAESVVETLRTRVAQFTISGKGLRGLLYLYACHTLSPDRSLEDSDWQIAAGLEMAQTALLIHDDVMDDDRERRGAASIFAQYAADYADTSEEVGKHLAICIGDVCLFYASELISASLVHQQIFAQELRVVGIGQMLDVSFGTSMAGTQPSPAEIREMYRLKTGRYSFSLPLILAATTCGVTADQRESLDRAGELLGVAFQIQDDLLGIFGTSEQTGKPIGTDIRQDKQTLGRALLSEVVTPGEHNELASIYGNTTCTTDQIDRVRQLFARYKIQEQLEAEVNHAMVEINEHKDAYHLLIPVFSYLQNRTH